mgnify:FL=1
MSLVSIQLRLPLWPNWSIAVYTKLTKSSVFRAFIKPAYLRKLSGLFNSVIKSFGNFLQYSVSLYRLILVKRLYFIFLRSTYSLMLTRLSIDFFYISILWISSSGKSDNIFITFSSIVLFDIDSNKFFIYKRL